MQASDTEFRDITGYGPDISEAFSTSRALQGRFLRVAISELPLLDNIEAVFTYCRAWLAGNAASSSMSHLTSRIGWLPMTACKSGISIT
ncbi:MAG: hypothetical protein R3D29_16625 [Nitratireductor sp.]